MNGWTMKDQGAEGSTVTDIRTRLGSIVGRSTDSVRWYLGIPYAAAPYGPNRLRRPRPHPGWRGCLDATTPGATVPHTPFQPPFNSLFHEPMVPGHECLNLNVWAPAGDSSDGAGHPVLVWIPGGLFTNGTGIAPRCNGAAFARDGIICVTINHRLGVDGFLCTGDADEDTNIGLWDQIAALEWVRDNIDVFGGDPDRVTVAGQGAGAMSIGALLSTRRGSALMQRAILQSGAGHTAITRAEAAMVAVELAHELGIEPRRDAFATIPVELTQRAQAAVTTRIRDTQDGERWANVAANLLPFAPVIDGTLLDDVPIVAIRNGSAAEIDVLIGSNSDEMNVFMVPSGLIDSVDAESFPSDLDRPGLPVVRAVSVYGSETYSPGAILAAATTDWLFRIPAIRLAEAQHRCGAQVHMYEFAWRSPLFDGRLGAGHAVEIPFAFDTLGAVGNELLIGDSPPQTLADEMHACWVAFIHGGDPGWDAYDLAARLTKRFDVSSEVLSDPHGDARAIWDQRHRP